MNITIANLSTQIPMAEFRQVVAAIQQQVSRHFEPEWEKGAKLIAVAIPMKGKKAPVQKGADAVIYLGDLSTDAGSGVKNALGYHAANNKGVPYGFVYLDICRKSKEAWSCTLSHEVLELLGDPDALLSVAGPSPKGGKAAVNYGVEVCDPTQGDQYLIGNVVVSNFAGRSYFGMSGGSGKTNHLNRPLAAFGVRPGGYLQYEQNGRTHTVWGKRVSKDQKAAKKLMRGVRRNARRVERLTAKS